MKIMKSFIKFLSEQKMGEEETTLSPDFLEKKEKRDRQVELRLEKPIKEVDKKVDKVAKEE